MLNIDIEYIKGVLFLRFNGVLNKETSKVLNDIKNNIIYKAGIKYLLINIEKLCFIDSYGINSIVDTFSSLDNGKAIIVGYKYNNMIKIENSKLFNYALNCDNEINALKIINI